jgi:hypothetical protein
MNNPKNPQTLSERRAFAEDAFHRDIESFRKEHEVICVPKDLIPKGAVLVECYHLNGEFVILGDPPSDETYERLQIPEHQRHNCDAMGCTSLSHVVLRVGVPFSE